MRSVAFIMDKIIIPSMYDLLQTTIGSQLYPLHSEQVEHACSLPSRRTINPGTNRSRKNRCSAPESSYTERRLAERTLPHRILWSNTMAYEHTNMSTQKTTFAFSAT